VAYTSSMNISVDEKNEQRIRREIELGHFRNPEEVIAHALELLDDQETWLLENQDEIRLKIERSFSQIERGEGVSGEEARRTLAPLGTKSEARPAATQELNRGDATPS